MHDQVGGQCAYAQLLREFHAFLECTYVKSGSLAVVEVARFLRSLDALVEDVESVYVGALPAVRGRRVAAVGSAATRLRKTLRGIQDVSDCREDWRNFGILYYLIFAE